MKRLRRLALPELNAVEAAAAAAAQQPVPAPLLCGHSQQVLWPQECHLPT